MLILVFAASEEDSQTCCCDKPTINFLLMKLREAVDSSERRSGGYDDIELLEGTCNFVFLCFAVVESKNGNVS